MKGASRWLDAWAAPAASSAAEQASASDALRVRFMESSS